MGLTFHIFCRITLRLYWWWCSNAKCQYQRDKEISTSPVKYNNGWDSIKSQDKFTCKTVVEGFGLTVLFGTLVWVFYNLSD